MSDPYRDVVRTNKDTSILLRARWRGDYCPDWAIPEPNAALELKCRMDMAMTPNVPTQCSKWHGDRHILTVSRVPKHPCSSAKLAHITGSHGPRNYLEAHIAYLAFKRRVKLGVSLLLNSCRFVFAHDTFESFSSLRSIPGPSYCQRLGAGMVGWTMKGRKDG